MTKHENGDCPVCSSELISRKESSGRRDQIDFKCPRCGQYVLPRTLAETMPREAKDAGAKISHAIRLMQQTQEWPELDTNTVKEILKRPLPKPHEQADIFIRWLADNIDEPGEKILVEPSAHMSIIGAKTEQGFDLILNHLSYTGLVELSEKSGRTLGKAQVTLSFPGWEYFEKLSHGGVTYRKAFMAMKFGESDLNNVLDFFFKPAVKDTGFELSLLSDVPKAGLIDDRLRVEIQASDFIIADLTHDNLGAYWGRQAMLRVWGNHLFIHAKKRNSIRNKPILTPTIILLLFGMNQI